MLQLLQNHCGTQEPLNEINNSKIDTKYFAFIKTDQQMKYKLLITTLFSMITIKCFANEGYSFSTGNYFYEHCKNINATNPTTQKQAITFAVNLGGCYAAAQTAFDDVINIGYLWTSSPNAILCFYDYYDIDHITSQQILDMTLEYIKNNPEHRNAKIGMIVAHMIHKNFPFPKSCINTK